MAFYNRGIAIGSKATSNRAIADFGEAVSSRQIALGSTSAAYASYREARLRSRIVDFGEADPLQPKLRPGLIISRGRAYCATSATSIAHVDFSKQSGSRARTAGRFRQPRLVSG